MQVSYRQRASLAADARPLLRLNALLGASPILFVLLFTALYGWNTIDYADFRYLTRFPFTTHFNPDRQFLHSSPFQFLLGIPFTKLLGPDWSYYLVVALGFAALVAALVLFLRKLPEEGRTSACFVLLSSPILLVLLAWMGKNDGYLLAFYLVFATVRGRGPWAAVTAALMVFCHREIGSVVLAVDVVLRRRIGVPLVLGWLVGVGVVWLYKHALTVPPVGRIAFAARLAEGARRSWTLLPVTHVVIGFGWFWTFLIARRRPIEQASVIAAALLCFAVASPTADYTRVLLVCAAPLLLYVAERTAKDPAQAQRAVAWPFPLLFLVQAHIVSLDNVRDMVWGVWFL